MWQQALKQQGRSSALRDCSQKIHKFGTDKMKLFASYYIWPRYNPGGVQKWYPFRDMLIIILIRAICARQEGDTCYLSPQITKLPRHFPAVFYVALLIIFCYNDVRLQPAAFGASGASRPVTKYDGALGVSRPVYFFMRMDVT